MSRQTEDDPTAPTSDAKAISPDLGFMGGELYFVNPDSGESTYKFEFVAQTDFVRIAVNDTVVYTSGEKKGRPVLTPNERVVKTVGTELRDTIVSMADKAIKLLIIEEKEKLAEKEKKEAAKRAETVANKPKKPDVEEPKKVKDEEPAAKEEVKEKPKKAAAAKEETKEKSKKAVTTKEEEPATKEETKEKPKKAAAKEETKEKPKKAAAKDEPVAKEKPKKGGGKKTAAVEESTSEEECDEKAPLHQRRKKIPKHIRMLVWNKYIGADVASTKCMSCREKTIEIAGFHCGHVIAEAKGGDMTITNLRPICAHCNLAMGTKSMNEFTSEFFGWKV
jgi:hypothetical protein